MAKFVVTTRKDGEFMFNLKARNGRVILTSHGYKTKLACLNGIDSVQVVSREEKRFIKNVTRDGRLYFDLKATNGLIIGMSEIYESEAGLQNAIWSVMRNAYDADIIDNTTA